MQFLFVVLMTVLLGASSLPHMLHLKAKPAYSQRKLSSFSLVSVPKFVAKNVALEEKPKIETSQQMSEASTNNAVADTQKPNSEAATTQAASSTPNSEIKESENLDRELAAYTGPHGAMIIDEADLKTCVCQGDKFMQCKLWIEGSCSEANEYVSVVARNPASNEFHKNLRCKSDNRFSGFIPVYGDQTLRMVVTFRDKMYKKDFSLTNHCGSFKAIPSSEDD